MKKIFNSAALILHKLKYLSALFTILILQLSCSETTSWETDISWNDYSGNPILTSENTKSPYGPYFGRVLFDNGKFKMWFSNSQGSDKYYVGYAESDNGLSWAVINNAVIEPGPEGAWDSYGVHAGAIIKENGIFKMYYTGQSKANDPDNRKIGLATSLDGISWTKFPESVTDQINIIGYSTHIIKVMGVYYLYYGNHLQISVAKSSDGLNWKKIKNSIITATYDWEGNRVLSCTVIYEHNKFKMLYSNSSLFNAFGYAESNDGIYWIKKNSPVFDYNETSNQWPFDIRYPYLVKANKTYFIFYSTVSQYHERKIGVATTTSLY